MSAGSIPVPAGRVRIGPECGRLTVFTARGGAAARLGHDLAIDVSRWSGDLVMPADSASAGTGAVDLEALALRVSVDLTSLTVRDGTGGALPLTDQDKREIDATIARLLGPAGTATFESTAAQPHGDGVRFDATLEIGRVRQAVGLVVTPAGGARFHGESSLRQSAFGIKPYSAMFGALRIRDEVTVRADVDLARAGAIR